VIKGMDQRLDEEIEYLGGKIITEFSGFDPAYFLFEQVN
jgi:hypothetical protein